MQLWIIILLMGVGASLAASIPISSNEIVSISMPDNTLMADLKMRGSFVDRKPQPLTSARSDPPASQMVCESDDDCGYHQFCYHDTKVCALCYDCSVYFRQRPSSSGCAKEPQMCGPCMEGYENELLSGGKARDTCTRLPTLPPEPIFDGTILDSPHMWVLTAFVGIGFVVTIGVLIAVWCRGVGKRWAQKLFWSTGNGSYQVYSLPSAPPLPLKECDISRHWVEEPLVRDHERERIVNTQSVPFDTSQTTSKCCGGEDEAVGPAQLYTGPSPVGPSPPELEDESTVPSIWTPQPWTEGTLITSFAGLFSPGTNNSANSSSTSNSLTPQHNAVQTFTPNSSFNDSDTSSSSNSNSSTGSGGATSGPHTSNVGGPVHILVQGGLGQSSVQCSVLVNNIQINEY